MILSLGSRDILFTALIKSTSGSNDALYLASNHLCAMLSGLASALWARVSGPSAPASARASARYVTRSLTPTHMISKRNTYITLVDAKDSRTIDYGPLPP
jgi:hypothetical protein